MEAEEVRRALTSDALVQRLAAVEHERWSHWQKYLHEQGERLPDGSLVLPAELVLHWQTQIETAYADLSLPEQESDVEQVQRYLPIVAEALGAAFASREEPRR